MPQLVTVRIHSRHGRRVRLWIPLLPVFIVLSPVLLLVLGAVVIGCLVVRVRPLRAVATGGRLLWALSGTQFEFQQGRSAVLVTVR